MFKTIKNITPHTLVLLLLIISSGCAVALIGAGAAGVYSISDDTVEAVVKHSPGYSYRQALKVMKLQGKVTTTDSNAWHIAGEVENASTDVWISYDPKTGKGSKITVRARSFGGAFPKISVAKKVLNEIMRVI